jgi:hypothetical protein
MYRLCIVLCFVLGYVIEHRISVAIDIAERVRAQNVLNARVRLKGPRKVSRGCSAERRHLQGF